MNYTLDVLKDTNIQFRIIFFLIELEFKHCIFQEPHKMPTGICSFSAKSTFKTAKV